MIKTTKKPQIERIGIDESGKGDYFGPLVIESFDPSFEVLNSLCAIWRRFAESGEALAIQGLRNLKAIASEIEMAPS